MALYSQFVLAKNPNVYLGLDANFNNQVPGGVTMEFNNANPIAYTFDTVIKKFGSHSQKYTVSAPNSWDYAYFLNPGGGFITNIHYEFWIYIEPGSRTDSYQINFNSTSTGTSNFSAIRIQTTNLVQFFTQSASTGTGDHTLTSNTALDTGVWNHIAVQLENGTTKRIYINGVLDNTATGISVGTGIQRYVTTMLYGPRTVYLDSYAIWVNTTLPTAADILARYNFVEKATKTQYWDGSVWQYSYDEKYWNGTAWVDWGTTRRWNGTAWVTI